jgi:hypothetical protein
MPRWVFRCPGCNGHITYRKVEAKPNKGRYDQFLGEPKPEVPTGGIRIDCPICNKTFLFRAHDLVCLRQMSDLLAR